MPSPYRWWVSLEALEKWDKIVLDCGFPDFPQWTGGAAIRIKSLLSSLSTPHLQLPCFLFYRRIIAFFTIALPC
jgi:hypothetical protein